MRYSEISEKIEFIEPWDGFKKIVMINPTKSEFFAVAETFNNFTLPDSWISNKGVMIRGLYSGKDIYYFDGHGCTHIETARLLGVSPQDYISIYVLWLKDGKIKIDVEEGSIGINARSQWMLNLPTDKYIVQGLS